MLPLLRGREPMTRFLLVTVVSALLGACSSSSTGNNVSAGSGGSSSGGACAWSGTWSPHTTPLMGNCNSAPAFPLLHVDADGGLTVLTNGSTTPCPYAQSSPQTCQIGGLCAQWQFSLNFSSCTTVLPCSGAATDLASSGDAGTCSVTMTLTHTGP